MDRVDAVFGPGRAASAREPDELLSAWFAAQAARRAIARAAALASGGVRLIAYAHERGCGPSLRVKGELCRGIKPGDAGGRNVVSHTSHGERLFAASGRWADIKSFYCRLGDA